MTLCLRVLWEQQLLIYNHSLEVQWDFIQLLLQLVFKDPCSLCSKPGFFFRTDNLYLNQRHFICSWVHIYTCMVNAKTLTRFVFGICLFFSPLSSIFVSDDQTIIWVGKWSMEMCFATLKGRFSASWPCQINVWSMDGGAFGTFCRVFLSSSAIHAENDDNNDMMAGWLM